MSKIKTIILFILLTAFAAPLFAWTEAGLTPSELPNLSGVNDSMATAAAIPNYQYSQTGYGYIGTQNDTDYYTFTVPAGDNYANHNVLEVQMYVPQGNYDYQLQVYEWNSGMSMWMQRTSTWGYNGSTGTAFVDISAYSGQDHNYAIQIMNCTGCNTSYSSTQPYVINMSVISTGAITGTVNPVGAGVSGMANINVSAVYNGSWISNTQTDSFGNFTLKVPVGLQITELDAARYWYPGCAGDWSYGQTKNILTTPITLTSPGQTSTGNNFNVYREGAIVGTVTASQNVDMGLGVPYSSQGSMNGISNTIGAYAFHNLAPGTYTMWVQPHAGYGSGLTVSYTANISVTDGFTTTVNYTLGSGNTVSGTLNPSPVSGTTQVQVYMPGHRGSGLSDWDPYSRYFRINVTGTAYAIQNVPDGVFDISASGNGPSMWFDRDSIAISGGATTINFSGPMPVTFIAGNIADNTGAIALTNVAVVAVVSGTADVIGSDILGYIGMCDASGNFSVIVPPDYNYYDLVALTGINNNGNPSFVAWAYNIVTGTANVSMAINNGIGISGGFYFNSKTIDNYNQGAQMEILKDMGGGVYKFLAMAMGNNGSPYYNVPEYLTSSAIPYHVVMKSLSTWFTDNNQDLYPSDFSLTNQNVNFTVDPTRDIYEPFAGSLVPAQNGVLINGSDFLYAIAGDNGALGSGLNSVQILSDGQPVSGITSSIPVSNMQRFQFNLPAGQQVPGSTHNITFMINDYNNNVFNLNNSSWVVSVATLTPAGSKTFTQTPTITATFTPTP